MRRATRDAAGEPDGPSGPPDPGELAPDPPSLTRSYRALPSLVAQAIGLVRRAAPKLLLATLSVQLGMAVMASLQIFAAEYALTSILHLQHGGSLGHAMVGVALLAASITATDATGVGQSFQQRLLSQHVAYATSQQLLDVTSSVELATFETAEFFEDVQRVQSNSISQILPATNGLITLLGGSLTVVTVAIALLRIQPLLPPILLVAGLPLIVLSGRGSKREFAFMTGQVTSMRLRYALQLLLTGRNEAKEIRSFDLTPPLRGRWEDLYRRYLTELRTHIRRRQVLHVAGSILAGVVTTGALAFVLWLVSANRLSLSGAGAALIGVRLLAGQVNQIFGGVSAIFEASLFLSDFRVFVAKYGRGDPTASSGPPLEMFDELIVSDLAFTYPGTTRQVLTDVSMTLPRGRVIALVGENGSGKTTLAKLLAGLYRPTRGTIAWDDTDTTEVDLATVRRHVSVIFQDFVRFPLTARENIALGGGTLLATDEKLRAATAPVGADRFLEALPHGYDTILSKEYAEGVDLSVGQWQRVAMARALFRDAQFVVLDEPTAALDARAEAELFTTIRESLTDKTVLLISHRFSSVRNADDIYVLHQGRIIEHGTHSELLRENGTYAELFQLQAAAYLDDAGTPAKPSRGL
jgi:ATP-binding cassette subfamily B protein